MTSPCEVRIGDAQDLRLRPVVVRVVEGAIEADTVPTRGSRTRRRCADGLAGDGDVAGDRRGGERQERVHEHADRLRCRSARPRSARRFRRSWSSVQEEAAGVGVGELSRLADDQAPGGRASRAPTRARGRCRASSSQLRISSAHGHRLNPAAVRSAASRATLGDRRVDDGHNARAVVGPSLGADARRGDQDGPAVEAVVRTGRGDGDAAARQVPRGRSPRSHSRE